MTDPVAVLHLHARSSSVSDRIALAGSIRADAGRGVVLLETCHRVEAYGTEADLAVLVRSTTASEASLIVGEAAARHLVRVAVGRDSVVVGEDQILHQLRTAVAAARRVGRLDPALERLLDVALGAGRRARSWLPGRRASLADVAVAGLGPAAAGRPVLVVGTGEMGRRAAALVAGRGDELIVASRSQARADGLAAGLRGHSARFDPGPAIASTLGGIIVALRGPWSIDPSTAEAIAASDLRLVDLSSPSAVDRSLAERLAARFVSIDDLATSELPLEPLEPRAVARLDALIEDTVRAYLDWSARSRQRSAARALVRRAREEREAELADLWRAAPDLDGAERAAIAAMARRISERLLREPLARLQRDVDGGQDRAVRELFGL
jgi:glutamyl-tRNA reductase